MKSLRHFFYWQFYRRLPLRIRIHWLKFKALRALRAGKFDTAHVRHYTFQDGDWKIGKAAQEDIAE